jgi:hypothetical protein
MRAVDATTQMMFRVFRGAAPDLVDSMLLGVTFTARRGSSEQ